MLQPNDIGRLFATLQAAYGHSWAHKSDAIPIWQEKLRNFDRIEIMKAANEAVEAYPDFPPSVGQFLVVLNKAKPRANTYLPPPSYDKANADKAWADMERLAGRKLRPDEETI